MRRILVFVITFCLLFTGCKQKTLQNDNPPEQKGEMIGVWLTYSELGNFAEKNFEEEFDKCIEKCKDMGINNIFVHVRPFCDAVYKSEIYPQSKYVEAYNGDALEYMVNAAHKCGIKIHAWINPYRVSMVSNDINTLPVDSPAKQWLTDDNTENDKNVCITENGIYLNPAENEVKKLILKGVREIIENYSVDGVHLDDYFYPTTAVSFDETSYGEYKQTVHVPLDLGDWRRQNVNSLIHTLYCAIKAYNKDIMFGISPAADIDRCYNELYADIEGWAHGGYVDYIMPQLYFGFEYPIERFRFDKLLPVWQAMLEDTNAALFVGLANYKIGTDNEPDKQEWNKENDIIAQQITYLREEKIGGFVFFSYSSLFSDKDLNILQTQKIKELTKNNE